jgi:hypothetical protein
LRPSSRLGVGMGSTLSGLVVVVLVPYGEGWVRIMFAVYAVAFYILGSGIIEQERNKL